MDIKNLVAEDDTEELDAEISALRDAIAERNLFSNSETEELEALIAKSMVLGELYERKKWQEAQAQAVLEGFVLVPREPIQLFKEKLEGYLVDLWTGDHGCDWDGFLSADAVEHDVLWKMMLEAQEQSHD